MNTTQREHYLDLYRGKLHRELDQMRYGRIQRELPAATVTPPRRPASAWAVAVALLLVMGVVVTQTLQF